MRGLHLKKRGNKWHYYRNRPRRFADIEPRPVITFALGTDSLSEAKLKAAQISHDLEQDWQGALERGVSLRGQDEARRYTAANDHTRSLGLTPVAAAQLTDGDLIERLRLLLAGPQGPEEQKAVLGLVEKPELSLSQAFDRFWEHIADDYEGYSHDQLRNKRNVFLKAIRNFEAAVGQLAFHDIKRSHAMNFRQWWLKRKQAKGLNSYTANREITALRRLFAVSYDIDGIEDPNPFARVRLKAEKEGTRKPLTSDQISERFLAPGKLDGLSEEYRLLILLMINTGARPVELIGLELADFKLDHEVPHICIRPNGVRVLKTPHSERRLPLLGVSLKAARQLVANGGWSPNRLGKNMVATSAINKWLRENKVFPEAGQSLYSLRHHFQDQLTKLAVVDRVQCQLMGHKFERPKYGEGLELQELQAVVEKFAL